VSVDDVVNTLQFRLNCKSRTFTFQTDNAQTKTAWIEDMRNAITGGHEEKQKHLKKDREVLLGHKQNNDSNNIDFSTNQSPKVKEHNNNHSPHQENTNESTLIDLDSKQYNSNNPNTGNPFITESYNPFLNNSNETNSSTEQFAFNPFITPENTTTTVQTNNNNSNEKIFYF